MQNRSLNKTGLRLMAVAGVLAGMLMILGCGGGEGEEDTTKVAASDTTASTSAALAQTVKAIEGETFTFSNASAVSKGGCTPACASLAGEPINLMFTNTDAPVTTTTLTAPNVMGSDGRPAILLADTTFGSCTFVVTSSTFPAGRGPQKGNTIKVDPCEVNIKTGGVQARGNATVVQILLHLGLVPSRANQANVTIDPDTGAVIVNNVNTGLRVTLHVLTGTGTTGTAGTP